ncbi:nitrous oxide reductase family maturation protein NosD [Ferrimonas sediminicola]|uniref:Nitrous oxide reductase family maturation protein NosD n=1 Tax=Ferrimonas sediminicola TaxID=2569538 RepID=A0A4U1BDC3_9GAMM|nr:nitrous oxide reductase family maturation protein NosD [Ferrimonas sediminicola]TKB48742.1 nitrous oxide reductase family maturation protein NosD [Ferrimonas sediminicola]
MRALLLLLMCLPLVSQAARIQVQGVQQLSHWLGAAQPGDELRLEPGLYPGHWRIDRPLILRGQPGVTFDAGGRGTALLLAADGIELHGLTVQNWGSNLPGLDAGIRGEKGVSHILIANNSLKGDGFGIRFDEGEGFRILGNLIQGDTSRPVVARGDNIYFKGSRDAVISGNRLSGGRDGVYVETVSDMVIDANTMSHQQYPVHYMYARETVTSHNRSHHVVGGYAIMGSEGGAVLGNSVEDAVEFGILLNISSGVRVQGNRVSRIDNPDAAQVFDGEGKGIYVYGAQDNSISGNRFQQCQIGIAMALGGEGNQVFNNDFVDNLVQVRYVGEVVLEWSHRGRGNYWSSYGGWDADRDGIGDLPYRPNDALDRLFWVYPEAKFLMDSPVVGGLRWLERQMLPPQAAGITDSRPRISPVIERSNL